MDLCHYWAPASRDFWLSDAILAVNMTTSASSLQEFLPSEYTCHFSLDEIRKLHRLNISDPYNAPGVLFKSITSNEDYLPDLRYADIHSYLVNFPSVYTGDSLRAYKGLDAYKWCQSGFVTQLRLWSLASKDFGIITARVSIKLSQFDRQCHVSIVCLLAWLGTAVSR